MIELIEAKTRQAADDHLESGDINKDDIVFVTEPGEEAIITRDKTFQFIPFSDKNGQILTCDGKKGIWSTVDILDLVSYGVEWSPDSSSPLLTRIGNMNYHRTLPIQSMIKGCIYNPVKQKVVYWLKSGDWRLREGATEKTEEYEVSNIEIGDNVIVCNKPQIEGETPLELSNRSVVVTKPKRYVTLDGHPSGSVIMEEVSGVFPTFRTPTHLPADQWKMITDYIKSQSSIRFTYQACLDGYDGEVFVYIPEFYIKSWDGPDKKSVRISSIKIDDTWEHQPSIFVSAFKCTILREAPYTDMGYLSTLPVNSTISVVNSAGYCRGGTNDSSKDGLEDPYRRHLNKPAVNFRRGAAREYSRLTGKELLSYRQYKNLYWLITIELATFHSQALYNPDLSSEGFVSSGLGQGVTEVTKWLEYNSRTPVSTNGNNLTGRNFRVIINPLKMAQVVSEDNPEEIVVPACTNYSTSWRGIQDIFGDIYTILDGIIVTGSYTEADGKAYRKVYTTDDPAKYSDNAFSLMEETALIACGSGTIKEFALGSNANIIPKSYMSSGAYVYKCDHSTVQEGDGLMLFMVGGAAYDGNNAGLACSSSIYGVTGGGNIAGYRLVCFPSDKSK